MEEYKEKIAEILASYEDGYNVFIKNHWDEKLKLKPGAVGTESWMSLIEKVTGIIGKHKYGLDTYENEIQILDVEQMLDVYVNAGMPYNYDHWTHGKEREQLRESVSRGQMNLAYEMVINSNPSISYCMTSNSNMMQALVIAHAAQGHNAFFKNNTMFKQFTNADTILSDLKRFAEYVHECEVKYGVDRVEKLLDACHALRWHAVDHVVERKTYRSLKQKEARKAAIELAKLSGHDAVLEATRIKPGEDHSFKSLIEDEDERPLNEHNLLRYIGKSAPHLKDWERRIIGMYCDRAQYFYPQMRTKLMNEGFASFTHHNIMNDLCDLGLISGGMMLEFIDSHTSVVRQPDFAAFNPYALGFAIYKDIERICKEPTDEDRRWFPEFAGNSDWISVIKEAAYSYHDESFIYQYLSPKVMRDFHMFAMKDDDLEEDREITAIHDDEGYRELRATLASSYDVANWFPQIEPHDYDERHDRTLTLKHTVRNRKMLEPDSAEDVMRHIYHLWQHPVVLVSYLDGEIDYLLSCPPDVTGRIVDGMQPEP